MIRACIGIAYPILYAPEGSPAQLETIPYDGRGPSNVHHGDLHIGNLMLGSPVSRFPEHNLVPVAKFVDFGSTGATEGGMANNMFKISTVGKAKRTQTPSPSAH